MEIKTPNNFHLIIVHGYEGLAKNISKSICHIMKDIIFSKENKIV